MKSKDTPFDSLRSKQKKKSENLFTSGGETIHRLIQAEYAMQGRLGAAEGILYDQQNMLISKVDVTLKDGTPVEVKSIGIEELREMSHPKFEHVAQLSYYVKAQGLQKGYIQYVARENTGVRKVFEIDARGLYKNISDASTQYMIDRRGGASQSKFDFALKEGLESFRGEDYYTKNYRRIAEEAKMFQSRLKEIQRKKDWMNTYRQLTSGLYEKNSLAVSGMQANFDTQSEWGSPTKRKILWRHGVQYTDPRQKDGTSKSKKEAIEYRKKRRLEKEIEKSYVQDKKQRKQLIEKIPKKKKVVDSLPIPKGKDIEAVIRERIIKDFWTTPRNSKGRFVKRDLSLKSKDAVALIQKHLDAFSKMIDHSPEALKKELLARSGGTLEEFAPNFVGRVREELKVEKANQGQLRKNIFKTKYDPVQTARTSQLRAASSLKAYDQKTKRIRFMKREEALQGPLASLIGSEKVNRIYDQLDAKRKIRKEYLDKMIRGVPVDFESIPDDLFILDRKGNELSSEIIKKKKTNFVRSIVDRRDQMVKDGTAKEYLERRERVSRRKRRDKKNISFGAKTLKSENVVLEALEKKRLPSTNKNLLFFDIETSYGKESASNFILEFAGTKLDKSAVEEIKTLQGLENLYRSSEKTLTKNALHLESTILNQDLISAVKNASSIEELVKSNALGKESLQYYRDRAFTQMELGRKVSMLDLIKEDVASIAQTTGSFQGDTFKVSEKYSGFKQAGTLEDFIVSQKQMVSQIDNYFTSQLDSKTALAGHNIALFDVNKVVSHADSLRKEIKGVRSLIQAEKVDTLTSDIAKQFFSTLREVSKDFDADLRASFFEKQEVFGGEKKKSIRALEHLSRAMGFTGEAASYSGQAHRASFDVFQQSIPVYSYMETFNQASEEEQKRMANELLQNYSRTTQTSRVLPEIVPEKQVLEAVKSKPLQKAQSEWMEALTQEARPHLRKLEHLVKQGETVLDHFFTPKGSRIHSTYLRRPGLGLVGLGVGALTVAGVAFSSMLGPTNTKPIRPVAKPLVHEDAAIFPEEESLMKIQQRIPTDFGSGYQGLKKVLQAPALKRPPIKNLEGLREQLPGVGNKPILNLKPKEKIAPPTTQVPSSPQRSKFDHSNVENNASLEKIRRRKKWRALNQEGTKAVFENNLNRVGHHKMKGY